MKLNQFMHTHLILRGDCEQLAEITKTEMVAHLLAAKAKIRTPATWTQGTEARDAKGEPVLASNASAVSFCSLGAMFASEPDRLANYVAAVFRTAARVAKSEAAFAIGTYNDQHTHSEVMQLWDDVISVVDALEE